MKPIDKTDGKMQGEFSKLDEYEYAIVDQQYKRDEKRVWKKARTKHLRNTAKEQLRELVEEYICE